MSAASHTVGSNDDQTMIIKQSCVYRAKYEVHAGAYKNPLKVVPPPQNRGGDSVKPLRCRKITSDIAKHGCDVVEAEQNAVLIEQPPPEEAALIKSHGINPDYDAHFAQGVLCTKDMCVLYGGG